MATSYQSPHITPEAVIPINETESNSVAIYGNTLIGLYMPSSFTGTAVTFKGALKQGGTFKEVTDPTTGIAVTATVAADKFVAFPPQALACLQFLKIVSNATEAAARTITVVARPAS